MTLLLPVCVDYSIIQDPDSVNTYTQRQSPSSLRLCIIHKLSDRAE